MRKSGLGESVGLGGAGGKVPPGRLAEAELMQIGRLDKGRFADLRLRQNFMAPAATAATKSASRRA